MHGICSEGRCSATSGTVPARAGAKHPAGGDDSAGDISAAGRRSSEHYGLRAGGAKESSANWHARARERNASGAAAGEQCRAANSGYHFAPVHRSAAAAHGDGDAISIAARGACGRYCDAGARGSRRTGVGVQRARRCAGVCGGHAAGVGPESFRATTATDTCEPACEEEARILGLD